MDYLSWIQYYAHKTWVWSSGQLKPSQYYFLEQKLGMFLEGKNKNFLDLKKSKKSDIVTKGS